jgi:hypothetical protein
MTLQEFIPIWQAQPFRAFNIKTARGVFPVMYPLQIGLSAEMKVAVVVDDTRAVLLSFDEIERCEVVGAPIDLAALISSVPGEKLARNGQLLAAATEPAEPDSDKNDDSAVSSTFDTGTVTFSAVTEKSGLIVVSASLSDQEGEPVFSTAGTRWNLHGVEVFENGTSLFLHHQDHPTVEQRIIIWPPDSGTFESFAEAKPLAALTKELHERDKQLTNEPARNVEPKAAYFRSIKFEVEPTGPDLRALAFGVEPEVGDPNRYALEAVPVETASKREVRTPRITDLYREEIIFDLTETAWDSAKKTSKKDQLDGKMGLLLHYEGDLKLELRLLINLNERLAQIGDDPMSFPLAFMERHLRNFALYEPWEPMVTALRAGPVALKQPNLVLPIPGGFRVELWSGERIFPLPFLQPRVLDPAGRTLLDLRTTAWATAIHIDENRPIVTLRFVSGDRENRYDAAHLEVIVDLISQRVTCGGSEGWTTVGMLQAVAHRVRGAKWMLEELPMWLAKGRRVDLR